jgi:hypothetical protein
MSAKFEQLLDHLVNENMDQANELFHEIVVEMSRGIYEQLIAEEEDESREMDEGDDDTEESVDEEMDNDDDSQEESIETEESYSMEGDDEEGEHGFAKGDSSDEFGASVTGGDDEEGHEKSEDDAIFDFKAAFEKLEAAFAELEAAQGGEEADMGMGPDMGDDEEGGDEMMGKPAFEGRRMTREYVEKVGNDWEKSGSQKTQGQIVGANTGESMPHAENTKSIVSSGKGKPATGATAENILRGGDEGGTPTGTSPAGKAGGFLSGAKDINSGNGNVPGGKMGVKNLSKVAGGHGAEKKGSGPGPVGAGTGDKAGQTSDANGTKKQFLPPHTRP